MIKDSKELARIRHSWKAVEVLQDRVKRGVGGALALGGVPVILVVDAACNLPFVHACAVLNDVLDCLAKERGFNYKGRLLGRLLEESETKLPWNNHFALIKEAAERRRRVAHEGEIVPKVECWKYVDAIKVQLSAWGIL